jgi:hypothetical protein
MKVPSVVFIENSFELCKGLTFVEFIYFKLFLTIDHRGLHAGWLIASNCLLAF